MNRAPTESAIFRKAEKEVNELSKRYPDHYMTLLVQGAYHLSKLYHRELKKDVDKNYMISKLNDWIKKLEELKHEIMMRKS